jgi:predicted ABC-type transport system involved in lysophospholipase L1 biosynthesis ATPase subunit
VWALAGVSVEISAGERIALLGRSGSGKTTLLHVIGGLVDPTAGSVQWHGRPLVSLDAAARGALRARGIGYVFQGANLLPHFNAFENVSFAAHLSREGETGRRRMGPADALTLVGLADKLDHLPEELSGGEAQRVAIARALAQGPELLLCDEPTGHLDSDTGERVLDLVDELQSELGFALVVATHDSSLAARLSRQIELEDGLVVRDEQA